MLDEVINQNALKDTVKIGIEWAADNLFQAAAGKYELENPNPKNFLDINQLVPWTSFSLTYERNRLIITLNYAMIDQVLLILKILSFLITMITGLLFKYLII